MLEFSSLTSQTTSIKMYFKPTLAVAAALAGSAVAAPGDCRPLRGSNVPAPSPNTPEAFASFSYYDEVANQTATIDNYETTMVARNAAILSHDHYLTHKEMPSYDVGACAKACDGLKECASCKSSLPYIL
jgi:hypothetical protein